MYWTLSYTDPTWKKRDDHYEISIPLAGASKEDVLLKVKKDVLFLSFMGNEYTELISNIKGEQTYKWSLPDGVKSKDVSAKLDKGVLTIKVKVPEEREDVIKIE